VKPSNNSSFSSSSKAQQQLLAMGCPSAAGLPWPSTSVDPSGGGGGEECVEMGLGCRSALLQCRLKIFDAVQLDNKRAGADPKPDGDGGGLLSLDT